MVLVVILFLLGLVLICAGGDKLVDAAVAISARIGIPQIVVGVTIVSFCTTLPEMLVSTTAVLSGSTAICLGNALGSVVCNTGLIAGLALLIRPPKEISLAALRWRCLFFLAVLIAMLAVGLTWGYYSSPVGLALLALFVVYAWLNIRHGKKDAEHEIVEEEIEEPQMSMKRSIVTLLLCAGMLFLGARLLVNNGVILAEAMGVSERVIAVTAIALGTSLPELVTTIVSLLKRYESIGLGNVIGANLLNLLLVIGIPAAFSTITLEADTLLVDMPLALGMMLILVVPLLMRKKGSRLQGLVLLLIYAGYCIAVL